MGITFLLRPRGCKLVLCSTLMTLLCSPVLAVCHCEDDSFVCIAPGFAREKLLTVIMPRFPEHLSAVSDEPEVFTMQIDTEGAVCNVLAERIHIPDALPFLLKALQGWSFRPVWTATANLCWITRRLAN